MYTKMAKSSFVVLTTLSGKWVWYPTLQVVDYHPKGSRKAVFTIFLPAKLNDETHAMQFAIKYEFSQIDTKVKNSRLYSNQF